MLSLYLEDAFMKSQVFERMICRQTSNCHQHVIAP
ncbi:polyphosphate kinase domain protein [Burkholderia mallei]|nr:polyphosphate kinase domain protein [Burkholderia mallei]